ncbi:hypothetical protein QF038_001913 [Pseudarthrobacter sp. W1I19]|nr:hypothetical protein [Pseudarthrobacter sp. W1I19]
MTTDATDDGVARILARSQVLKLRPGSVPARGLVREDSGQNLAFELAFFVLIQRADAHVPDPLPTHLRLPLVLSG